MKKHAFERLEAAYESRYFLEKEQQLVDKLRAVFHKEIDKQSLRETAGISDEQLLERLAEIQVGGDMLIAFKLLPIIEVAWADGPPDAKERRAVLEAGEKFGVFSGTRARELFERRLAEGPTRDLRKVWFLYAEALRGSLSEKEIAEFREDLLALCRSIAETSGGIFGMILKTSAAEQFVIDTVRKALS